MLKPLLSRLRQRFNVSVAETGEQDEWQSAVLAVVCVSGDSGYAHGMLEQVLAFIERDGHVEIVFSSVQII